MMRVWKVCSLLLLVACDGSSDDELAAIDGWLRCHECDGAHAQDQLRTVLRMGDEAVDTLARRLRNAPPQAREDLRRQLVESYDRMRPGSPAGRDAYVDRYVENFDATYQSRAATTLSRIRTNKAREVLQRALDSSDIRRYRSDVLRTIQSSLAFARYDTLQATITPTAARFLDTVRVSQGTAPWDGDEWVILGGAPFPDSLVVSQQPESLKFVAVGDVGTYAALLTNLGPGNDTQVVSFSITRVRYTAHSPSTAPILSGSPFPKTQYVALGAATSDTVDYFRFQPASDMNFGVNLEWLGPRAYDVTWHSCVVPGEYVNFLGTTISGVLRDERRVPIANALVRIPALSRQALSDTLGAFRFTGIVPAAVTIRVERIGFRAREYVLQKQWTNLLTLLSNNANRSTARNVQQVATIIQGGQCRLLRLGTRRSPDPQIARLRITSP